MPKARAPDTTREALLNAATELFAQHGFDGTTVNDIARRARVNPALISYHFGGKRKLYQAILRETFAAAAERAETIRQSPDSPEERLRAFIEGFQELVRRRPSFPRMVIREAISAGNLVDRSILPYFLNVFTLVREILDQGTHEGRFRPVNPVFAHLSLIGALVFFCATDAFRRRIFAQTEVSAESLDPDAFARHMFELITRGLAPEPTSREI